MFFFHSSNITVVTNDRVLSKGERDEDASTDHSSTTSGSSTPSTPRSERSSHRRPSGMVDDTGQHIRPRVQSNTSSRGPGGTGKSLTIQEEVASTSLDRILRDDKGNGVLEPAFHFGDFEQRRRMRELHLKKKFYEFYAAPITKFWSWSMAYFFFLVVFTYTVLIRTPETPEWNEYINFKTSL